MGKIQTTKSGGARFYISAEDNSITVPGVTSVLNMFPKGFLPPWYASMTAQLAVDSIDDDYLSKMVKRDPKGALDWLKGAAKRYTGERQDIGSEAHTLFELMIRGEELPELGSAEYPTRVQKHVENFDQFLQDAQPELVSAEDVAWSDTHGYAGSYDAELLVKLNPETGEPDPQGEKLRLILDWKTGKRTYEDVSLQLSAYAHADRIISADGTSRPMPEWDGGAVLHVTDTAGGLKPVRINEDLHRVFLEALRFFHVVQKWEGSGWGRNRIPGMKDDVIGKPIWKTAPKRRVTGTERRA